MFDLLFGLLLLLNTLQLLKVAAPAPDPWRRPVNPSTAAAQQSPPGPPAPARPPPPGRPAAPPLRSATLPHLTGSVPRPPAQGMPRGHGGTGGGGGGRRAPRPRGRRGGVQWRRHGDIGNRHLIIGQLNAQSVLPKLPDIRADIDSRFSFDVLMLSETWTTERTPDRMLNISGYRLVRRDRPRGSRLARGHGGVALYVRESFETEVLSTPVTGVRDSNLEMLWVTVRVGKCRRLLIGTAYRVPKNTGEQLTADLDDLEAQLQHMLVIHPGLTVVLGGDINCCMLKSDNNNSPGNRLRSLLDRHGLQICNTAVPTYRPAGSLLDILATNRSELVDRAGVTRCHYGTPHDYTRLALRLSEDRSRGGQAVRRRCLANVDKGQFNYQLLNAD